MLGIKDGLHKFTEAPRAIPTDGVHVVIDSIVRRRANVD
jgi:hypothetical protein